MFKSEWVSQTTSCILADYQQFDLILYFTRINFCWEKSQNVAEKQLQALDCANFGQNSYAQWFMFLPPLKHIVSPAVSSCDKLLKLAELTWPTLRRWRCGKEGWWVYVPSTCSGGVTPACWVQALLGELQCDVVDIVTVLSLLFVVCKDSGQLPGIGLVKWLEAIAYWLKQDWLRVAKASCSSVWQRVVVRLEKDPDEADCPGFGEITCGKFACDLPPGLACQEALFGCWEAESAAAVAVCECGLLAFSEMGSSLPVRNVVGWDEAAGAKSSSSRWFFTKSACATEALKRFASGTVAVPWIGIDMLEDELCGEAGHGSVIGNNTSLLKLDDRRDSQASLAFSSVVKEQSQCYCNSMIEPVHKQFVQYHFKKTFFNSFYSKCAALTVTISKQTLVVLYKAS